MFGNSKTGLQETTQASNSSNILSNDTIIEGDIKSSGNLRIEGKVIGNIITKAKLVLGPKSNVKGRITAQTVDIAGTVDGTVDVMTLLTLKPTAVVRGEIITHKLAFEEGSSFDGTCKMKQKPSEIKIDLEPKPELKINEKAS
jgi:cytoskeletal protein CcmA (bactofilin family)